MTLRFGQVDCPSSGVITIDGLFSSSNKYVCQNLFVLYSYNITCTCIKGGRVYKGHSLEITCSVQFKTVEFVG